MSILVLVISAMTSALRHDHQSLIQNDQQAASRDTNSDLTNSDIKRIASSAGSRLNTFRSDLGRKRSLVVDDGHLADLTQYEGQGGRHEHRLKKRYIDNPLLQQGGDIEKRFSSAFRSDLGKRLSDLTALGDDDIQNDKRRLQAFRTDLGKRPEFRTDLGKRDNNVVDGDEEIKRFSSFRTDLGKRYSSFRSDLGKRDEMDEQDVESTGEYELPYKRFSSSFRSDLGKRVDAVGIDQLSPEELGPRVPSLNEEDKRRLFSTDLGKRSVFRTDLGKRSRPVGGDRRMTAAFRSDLGKRVAFRSDLG
jgi:hypothetical protein